MAKEKEYKCPQCGQNVKESECIKLGKRSYHKECLDLHNESATKKKEEKDTSDWGELYRYLCELHGKPPTGMMFKQIGDYRKPPYEYTDKGMYLTLKYFHETLGNPVLENSGIGIIAYMYEEAKLNFIKNMDISEHNNGLEWHEQCNFVKVDSHNGQRRIKPRFIDFTDIDNEDEEDNNFMDGGFNNGD